MDDVAFYDAGCQSPRGFRRIVIPFRRVLRRLLRPIFLRQAELLQQLGMRIEEMQTTLDRVRGNVQQARLPPRP